MLYYNDNELQQRYRFGRHTIEHITRLLQDDISPITNRNHSVSATRQVLITLRFFALGSFQQVIGDSVAGLDKSTVSRIVRRVTLALSQKVDQFIRFPQTQEKRNIAKKGFYNIANFPCAIAPTETKRDFVNQEVP